MDFCRILIAILLFSTSPVFPSGRHEPHFKSKAAKELFLNRILPNVPAGASIGPAYGNSRRPQRPKGLKEFAREFRDGLYEVASRYPNALKHGAQLVGPVLTVAGFGPGVALGAAVGSIGIEATVSDAVKAHNGDAAEATRFLAEMNRREINALKTFNKARVGLDPNQEQIRELGKRFEQLEHRASGCENLDQVTGLTLNMSEVRTEILSQLKNLAQDPEIRKALADTLSEIIRENHDLVSDTVPLDNVAKNMKVRFTDPSGESADKVDQGPLQKFTHYCGQAASVGDLGVAVGRVIGSPELVKLGQSASTIGTSLFKLATCLDPVTQATVFFQMIADLMNIGGPSEFDILSGKLDQILSYMKDMHQDLIDRLRGLANQIAASNREAEIRHQLELLQTAEQSEKILDHLHRLEVNDYKLLRSLDLLQLKIDAALLVQCLQGIEDQMQSYTSFLQGDHWPTRLRMARPYMSSVSVTGNTSNLAIENPTGYQRALLSQLSAAATLLRKDGMPEEFVSSFGIGFSHNLLEQMGVDTIEARAVHSPLLWLQGSRFAIGSIIAQDPDVSPSKVKKAISDLTESGKEIVALYEDLHSEAARSGLIKLLSSARTKVFNAEVDLLALVRLQHQIRQENQALVEGFEANLTSWIRSRPFRTLDWGNIDSLKKAARQLVKTQLHSWISLLEWQSKEHRSASVAYTRKFRVPSRSIRSRPEYPIRGLILGPHNWRMLLFAEDQLHYKRAGMPFQYAGYSGNRRSYRIDRGWVERNAKNLERNERALLTHAQKAVIPKVIDSFIAMVIELEVKKAELAGLTKNLHLANDRSAALAAIRKKQAAIRSIYQRESNRISEHLSIKGLIDSAVDQGACSRGALGSFVERKEWLWRPEAAEFQTVVSRFVTSVGLPAENRGQPPIEPDEDFDAVIRAAAEPWTNEDDGEEPSMSSNPEFMTVVRKQLEELAHPEAVELRTSYDDYDAISAMLSQQLSLMFSGIFAEQCLNLLATAGVLEQSLGQKRTGETRNLDYQAFTEILASPKTAGYANPLFTRICDVLEELERLPLD